jgi:hypothetical protein
LRATSRCATIHPSRITVRATALLYLATELQVVFVKRRPRESLFNLIQGQAVQRDIVHRKILLRKRRYPTIFIFPTVSITSIICPSGTTATILFT